MEYDRRRIIWSLETNLICMLLPSYASHYKIANFSYFEWILYNQLDAQPKSVLVNDAAIGLVFDPNKMCVVA
jgi:hypothetical protein